MSAGRGTRLSRKRKIDADMPSVSGSSLLDITDDFQDSATLFRLPSKPVKKVKTESTAASRPRGRPKKIGTKNVSHSDVVPRKDAERPELLDLDSDSLLDQPDTLYTESEDSQEEVTDENNFLVELEKSICSESEKLCPCCKHIVSCATFGDHFRECLQKFKLTKSRCEPLSTKFAKEEIRKAGKAEDNQALLCPVCMKSQKSKIQCHSHMKICARTHGLSSEQLLLASRLLEKQAEERRQLGLPFLVQKDSVSHKYEDKVKKSAKEYIKEAKKDPDLAMALALSRSFAEEEAAARASREEKLLALGLDQIVDEDRQVQPVIFPHPVIDNERAATSQTRKRRRRHGNFSKMPLSTRSVEERERIVSEKVAAILTSEDMPRVNWKPTRNSGAKGRLSKFKNEACRLWEASHSSTDLPLEEFYVSELEPYIKPMNIAVGGLLRRLSEIPGRLNLTTVQSMSDENSDSGSESEETSVINGYCTQLALAELLGSQNCLELTRACNSLEEDESIPQDMDALPNPNVILEPGSGFWVVHTTESVASLEIPLKSDDNTDKNYSKDESEIVGSVVLGREKENPISICDSSSESNSKSQSDNLCNISPVKVTKQQCLVIQSDLSMVHENNSDLESASEIFKVDKSNMTGDELYEFNIVNISDQEESISDNVALVTNCPEDNYEGDQAFHKNAEPLKSNLDNKCKENDNLDCEVIPISNINSDHTLLPPLENRITGPEHPSGCSSSSTDRQRHSGKLYGSSTSQQKMTSKVSSSLDENSNTSEYSNDSNKTQIFFDEEVLSNNCTKSHDDETTLADNNKEELPSMKTLLPISREEINDHLMNKEENGNCEAPTAPLLNQIRMSSNDLEYVGSPLEEKVESEEFRSMQKKLIYDWSILFSNEDASDVTVITQDGSIISAHSLVFLARCPQLYKEAKAAEMRVKWDELSFEAATTFLVYLYTGTCSIKVRGDPLWMDVFDLALKYKCRELVLYLESIFHAATATDVESSIETGSRSDKPLNTTSNSNADILITKKTSNMGNNNKNSGRSVKRCLKLSPFDKSVPLPKSSRRISLTGNNELNTTADDNSLSEGLQIINCQSPDLFDVSVPVKDASFISTPSKSSLTLLNNTKSPQEDSACTLHLEPDVVSKKISTKNSDKVNQAKENEIQNKSMVGSTGGSSPRNDNADHGEGSSLLKLGDQSKLSNCPEAGGNIIDLTLSSNSENSPASSTHDTLIKEQINTLDFHSEEEEMEPLKLWSAISSPRTDEISQQDLITEDYLESRKSLYENVPGSEQESVNKSYNSNVWDDFDDVENDMSVPVNAYTTPAKCRLQSDASSKTTDDISPILRPFPHVRKDASPAISPKTNICGKIGSQYKPSSAALYQSAVQEGSPRLCLDETDSSVSNIKGKDTESEKAIAKDKEENLLASGSFLGDETMVKITEHLDCEEVWLEFEEAEGCKQSQKRLDSRDFHVPRRDLMTPQLKKNSRRKNVTPLPDYKNMSSPDLKKQLTTYGVRPLGRRKAVVLLQHLYEQTHPLVTDSEADSSFCETPNPKTLPSLKSNMENNIIQHDNMRAENKKSSIEADGKQFKKLTTTENKEKVIVIDGGDSDEESGEESSQLNSSQISSTSTEGASFDCLEESMVLGIDDDDNITSTQQVDLHSKVLQFITSDPDLHHKVLLYEPIFIKDLQESLKVNGIKCSMKILFNLLDDQCITFRTKHQRTRRRGNRKSKKSRKN